MTSEPRAANVVSTSKGIAFSIDKRTFEKVLGKMSDLIMKAQDVRLIGGVPFIHDANLNSDQLEAIACHVVEKQYKKGDIIFEEGSSIQASIYLVRMNGKIALKSCNNNDDNKFNGDVIGGGGYFGECIALAAFQTKDGMTSAPYTATASEDTVCGILAMNDCLHIIGSIYGNDMKVGTTQQQLSTIQFEDLEKIDILGEGTFGQVWLVRDKTDDNSPPYALKIQSKYDLIKEGQAKASLREKKVMSQLRHPFLVRLMNTYQDAYFIYILLQSIQGGELFTLIHEYKTHAFPEQQAKFYVLAIADALVYMGLRHFVYRDLKPENVMIDEKGYPILVDFGFAKHVADKTFTICGTLSGRKNTRTQGETLCRWCRRLLSHTVSCSFLIFFLLF